MINERGLASAQPWIQEIATRTGGIRSTQLILSGNVVAGVAPYGLWWPWDESQTISLRIGLEGATNADQDLLAECFGAMR